MCALLLALVFVAYLSACIASAQSFSVKSLKPDASGAASVVVTTAGGAASRSGVAVNIN